eukprot:NODE_40_length_35084_cov_0.543519.p9 type:complete len:372 gc:universal NODE_40_length_35084_cov_0.543519:11522-10407(-)
MTKSLKDQVMPALKSKTKREKSFKETKLTAKDSQKIMSLMQEKKLDFQLDAESEKSDISDHSDYDEELPMEGLSKEELNAISSFFPSHVDLSESLKKIVPKEDDQDYDLQLQNLYKELGDVLSKFTSGRLPVAFKFIPKLPNWEFYLQCTNPDTWTPHTFFHASRIYISTMKPHQATVFMKYLLFAARRDILKTKKLNYHLYMALKKALYKPSAFFKGFLFPLCQQNCTLKEAVIISSIMVKCTIPVLHSCAAILKLTQLPYSGGTSIFLRVLLDKKYALPYKVIDAVVKHFIKFKNGSQTMTVLWYQSLLVFCQRYKNDLSNSQIELLLDLNHSKRHHLISPEIKRELLSKKNEMQIDNGNQFIDVIMED